MQTNLQKDTYFDGFKSCSITEFFIIFSSFFGISQLMASHLTWPEKIMSCGANCLVNLSFSLSITGFTNILVLAFRSLGDLTGALQTELVDTDTGKEREEILNIIRDLDRTGPFTGMGYFDITNGTLTAMTSVGFTYLIILVQFRQS